MDRPGLRSKSCKGRLKKHSRSWRLETCERVNVDEATRRSPQMGVVSTQAYWSNAVRLEQRRRGSTCQSYRMSPANCVARRTSQRQQRQCTRGRCQKGRQARSSQAQKKQEGRWTKSSENPRVAIWSFWRPLLFLIQLYSEITVQATVTEVGSPRPREAGDNLTTKTKSRSPRVVAPWQRHTTDKKH